MQAGLYYGAVDMVDGMLTRMKAELGGDGTNADPKVSGLNPSCVKNATNSNNCVGIKTPAGWNPAFWNSNKASAVLAAVYPTITNDAANPALNNNNYALPNAQFTENYNSYTVRGDWIVTAKNSVFGGPPASV